MSEKKREDFLFEGLGFPIMLINVRWKKVLGQWALDINFKKLQEVVLQALIHKSAPLTGEELRFIRKFLEMSTVAFGKMFGVSHVAVVKWESNKTQINPATELCIRLHVMDQLLPRDKEFRKFYHDIRIENLAKTKKGSKIQPIEIDLNEELSA